MSLLKRILNVGRDERLARDIDREMAFHLRERVEELRVEGYSEREANQLARRQFGNRTYQGEVTRDADVIAWLDSLRGDVRYAFRALRRSPAFTMVAVASLALGIGANTAIYSLLNAVVLRPLPVPHPERLVHVTSGPDDESGYFTNPIWEELRDRQTGFSAVAAFSEANLNIADGGEVRHVQAQWAGGDFFALFGARAALGRIPTRDDDVRGCPATAVLSHGFWQSEYGGNPDVIGRTISLEGTPFEIVAVTARGFTGPIVGRETQLFAPLCSEAVLRGERSTLDARSTWWMRVMGQRDAAVSIQQLAARLAAIAPQIYEATVPPRYGETSKAEYLTRSLAARPAESGLSSVRVRYAGPLKVMMGAVALVLLIACANVANLLLARAAARQREIAIRMAVGAGRRRLVRQLATESAILALLGAAVGLLIAHWGTHALLALISTEGNPIALDLSLNLRVLGFTALVAATTATIFGLIPAWRGTRVSPQTAMKTNARGLAEGHRHFTISKSLVVAQVALSLTLLVGAGLLVASLRNLQRMDPGFTADGVLMVSFDLRRMGIPADQYKRVNLELLERMRSLPGVRSAAMSDLTPVGGSSWNDVIAVEGFTPASEGDALAWFNEVSDGYFTTLDTKLIGGRDFDRTDVPTGPRMAIVNEAFARKFFGDAPPLGRRFHTRVSDEKLSDPYTVIGLVEDAKYQSLRETSSETIYLPSSQNASGRSMPTIALRAAGDPLALVPMVKASAAEMHRTITLSITTLDGQLARTLQRERMLAVLSTVFGSVALALSMLGLYGVMAYTVARRRNEIGVRIALGADNGRVLRMVLGDVARVVAIGLVIGAAGSLASGKLVASFLYGMEPAEPAVMGASAALLALVALGAGFVPAWRASRVDPVAALREE